MQFFSMG